MGAMKKFYILSMLAYGLLAVHILEESLRLGRESAELGVLIPFIFFPLGFIGIYLNRKWGFWFVFIMTILVALLPTLSHLVSSSESYVGTIFSFWGGLTGAVSVAVALLLSLFGIAALVTGMGIVFSRRRRSSQPQRISGWPISNGALETF